MSKYSLEIESVGDDTYIVMSRGHHDLGEFMRAAVDQYPDWQLGGPVHKWCKTVPDRSGNLACRYAFVEQGTRGAWPATYCWEYGDDWERWSAASHSEIRKANP